MKGAAEATIEALRLHLLVEQARGLAWKCLLRFVFSAARRGRAGSRVAALIGMAFATWRATISFDNAPTGRLSLGRAPSIPRVTRTTGMTRPRRLWDSGRSRSSGSE